jgi:hypothetical protein
VTEDPSSQLCVLPWFFVGHERSSEVTLAKWHQVVLCRAASSMSWFVSLAVAAAAVYLVRPSDS